MVIHPLPWTRTLLSSWGDTLVVGESLVVLVSNVHISIYIFIPISHDVSLSTREGDEIERYQVREMNEGERERERET